MTSTHIVDHERWLSAMPAATKYPWYQRLLRSPLLWLTVILIPFYAYALYSQYAMLHPDQTFPDGTVALGLNNESLAFSAFWAMWTALAWGTLFLLLDRFRPQRIVIWILAFGWGAAASTFISIHINSWAAEMMNTTQANSDMGSRAAVFIAPFVEETSKGTVLFLLVILFRSRLVSQMSIVTLAGLSAVGFAFTENIIYYARAFVYTANTSGLGTPQEETMELIKLRGIYTSFGHPMFTIMLAFGLAVGLGARSKIVRVMAPLAGFIVAASAHMLFNGLSSTGGTEQLKGPWYYALGLVALIAIYLIFAVISHGRQIRQRLEDYQRHGWLGPRDPEIFSSLRRRLKLRLSALLRGPKAWWRTRIFIQRMTELAHIRDGLTRGVIAQGGISRAHDILLEIEQRRPTTIWDPKAQPVIPPRVPKRRATQGLPPPQAPGPAGLAGQWGR